MDKRELVRTSVIVVMIVGVLVSCGQSRPSPAANHLNGSGFRSDIETWSLPLDSLLVDERTVAEAQDLLYTDCMRAEGIQVRSFDILDYLPPTRNRVLRRLFNVKIATRYGYHSGPTKKNPASLPKPDLTTPAAQRRDQACMELSARQLGENQELIVYVQHLAGQAEATAEASVTVQKATVAWRMCMRQLDITDLPGSPNEMPTRSQRTAFGLTELTNPGPGQLQKTTQPGPEEIRAASFDARCRDTSGYATALYGTEIHIEQDMINHDNGKLADAQQAEQRSALLVAAVLHRG